MSYIKKIFKITLMLSKNDEYFSDEYFNHVEGYYGRVFHFSADSSAEERRSIFSSQILKEIEVEKFFNLYYFDNESQQDDLTRFFLRTH